MIEATRETIDLTVEQLNELMATMLREIFCGRPAPRGGAPLPQRMPPGSRKKLAPSGASR